jgi:hypothetical protein
VKEEIRHAAVKAANGFLSIGKCHADCFYQLRNIGLKASFKSSAQGFVTNKGRYVNRKKAALIARKAKQILKRHGKRSYPTSLLSEDIWYRRDIIYCQMRGYCKIVEPPTGGSGE